MRPQDYSHARQGVHPHIYRSTVEYLDGLQGVAAINTASHTRSRVPKPTMITLPLRLYLSPSKKIHNRNTICVSTDAQRCPGPIKIGAMWCAFLGTIYHGKTVNAANLRLTANMGMVLPFVGITCTTQTKNDGYLLSRVVTPAKTFTVNPPPPPFIYPSTRTALSSGHSYHGFTAPLYTPFSW